MTRLQRRGNVSPMSKIIQFQTAPGGWYLVYLDDDGDTITSPVAFWVIVEDEDGKRRIEGWDVDSSGPFSPQSMDNFVGYCCGDCMEKESSAN